MLDVCKLRAPKAHGGVLVAPSARECALAAQNNGIALRSAEALILDVPLREWRRQAREAVAGVEDAPVIVVGHQPEFFHPGVWAKHVAAVRLAEALDGVAVNLVVDNDAVQRTVLAVPCVRSGSVTVEPVRFLEGGAGFAYEQVSGLPRERLDRFGEDVRAAMGNRFKRSQMPVFLEGLRSGRADEGWVGQMIAARRAVEARFGIGVTDRRVSGLGLEPFVADVLLRAERLAAAYNAALSWYRRAFHVRGANQPIPDLHCAGGRYEVPLWAYRGHGPRRRVAVERNGSELHLYAGAELMGSVGVGEVVGHRFGRAFVGLGGWRIRPRALALTLWARLFLADLFIHGIGGAKYDRITDVILKEHYGIEPPEYACVTATLHLDLPTAESSTENVRALRRSVRDLHHNPQRHLDPGPDIDPLLARREEAVGRSIELRRRHPDDHAARRAAFEAIRGANHEILARRREAVEERSARLEAAIRGVELNRISRGREYFFGLYDDERLGRLVEALPAAGDFRV